MTTRIPIDRCTHHRAFRAKQDATQAALALTGAATIAALNRADCALKAMIENAREARLGVKRLRADALRAEKRAAADRAVIEQDREWVEARA